MKDKSLALLAFAFVAFVCIGLAAAYVFSGSSSAKVFDISNNTQTIEIKNGEVFKVLLDENPGTGYAWVINLTPGLALVNDTYVAPEGNLVGAGGQHEWQIKAAGTGDQTLTGVYKRAWEQTSGNETTYTLNIKIV